MGVTRRLFLASALLLLLLVAGPAAAQDATVEGVAPAAEEIAANARAKEAAVLASELVQLRAKISALDCHILYAFFLLSPVTFEPYPSFLDYFLWQVHGAWLPPWLATHAARSMEVMSNHWNEHGKPAVDNLLQKASEKSARAKKWAEPHLETAKTKWMPIAKEKWVTLKTNAEPYVQMVSEKSVEVYQKSSDFIRPHLVNAHQVADPYLQAQTTISDYLHQHEFTKQFVTEELVWYLACALLLMPVFVVYTLLIETFWFVFSFQVLS
nr:unnamed protein product [Digitaria exilis]